MGHVFEPGSLAFVMYRTAEDSPEVMYEVKVLKLDKDRKDMYFIHYQGWKQSTDCWVSELIPYTEQAKAKKEELDEEAEEYVRQVKEERMTRRRERHRAASKLAKAEEDAQPDTNGLRITLSATLKKILFEDFENITLKKMLLRIPRKPSVEQVLEEYIEYSQQDFGLCSPTGKVAPETAVQIVNGLTIFFERCIGPYLLYEFEKLQYDAIRERVPENENDVLLPDLANKKRKRLARMYGTEHLLRMFVKLPILFEGHKLLCGETETLHLVLHDILKFIAKCRDRYISPNAYEPASDDYLMIVQDL
uniref:MRG domain-containing protein n=1 Tax=Mucochytrium quahogii TaxID=96639 RepID=A0A7S2WIP0_9STRA|mmetsp:Transcript_36786/g.59451  ORF Transcript_36786/g.59451 Transcript_36786/m.59451 type:complete len:306 (+) Transcript_36786:168-1085(+)|eukprot:CAMPEP_0203755502 /NCGR_PEP_ID=MMETSP0098-20131031/8944_1 /ASSEMBLY_ACC=CAM_ASM_000208 /TAXON_ID=96639 /ORGANISM=" , Strain NY0313808BC1" /LENGTH=305 /DNA_ID=CAMNT_0050646991 /DNA_START=112 /DNA_END=1026 /DNA_ORIENTATION=-